MKTPLLLVSILFTTFSYAQKEVGISYTKKAFLMAFKEPYTHINLDFDDDVKGFYSNMQVGDSLLVFRSEKEFSKYEDDLKKYYKAIERAEKEKEKEIEKEKQEEEKALKEGKPRKESKKKKVEPKEIKPPDLTTFLTKNREILKGGLELDVNYEEFRTSKQVVVRRIVITTDLDKKDDYEGVFERLDGDIATIDGRGVRLKENTIIKGKPGKGFEGKTFASFKDMMLGSIVNVKGRRQADGILLADEGLVWENAEEDIDRQIKTSLKNTMKLSANEVTFGTNQFVFVKNAAVQTYVSKIGRNLIPQYQKELDKSHPAKIDFNFYVIQDSTFNACAYPDGSIFVHSALLEELENEAQLAAIIGHEIAHVTYEHARKNFETGKKVEAGKTGVKVLAKVVEYKTNTAIPVEDVAVLVASVGGKALSSKYSRNLESQADRNGLTYMINAGYDPREASKVWKRLALLSDVAEPEYHFGSNLLRAASKGIETIYASHPDAIDRYKSLNRLLSQNMFDDEHDNKKVGKEEYSDFKRGLKRVIKGQSFGEPISEPKKEQVKTVAPAGNKPASNIKSAPKTPTKKKN